MPLAAVILIGSAAPAAAAGWWPFGAGTPRTAPTGQTKGAATPAATGSATPQATGSATPATGSVAPMPQDLSPRIHVSDISVEGNHHVTEEEILLSLPIHAGEDVTRSQVLDALRAIYGMGYFMDVKATTQPTATGDRLIFHVVENPELKGVQITGMTVFDPKKFEAQFAPYLGQIIDLTKVQEIIKKLEKRYQAKGYILARVVGLNVEPDGTLRIQVSEGKIQQIKIEGNKETKDYVIRRELTLKPGMLFNFHTMEDDLRRVYNLGYFSDIGLKYEPGKTPDQVVVIVNVKEKQTGMFQLSAGYSNVEGPLGIVSLKKDNLLGRGMSVSADLTISRDPSADLTWFNPWIDNQHTSLGVSLYDSRYANYLNQGLSPLSFTPGNGLLPSSFDQEERRGAQVTVGRPLFGNPVTTPLRGSLSLKGEWVGVQREADELPQPGTSTASNSALIASPQDTVSGHIAGGAGQPNSVAYDLGFSVGGTLTYDTRDYVLNPTTGWDDTLSLEQYTGPFVGNLDLTKANLSVDRFFPVWPSGTVLAFGSQLATTLSFWNHKIPSYEHYYATGPYLIRGWSEVLPAVNSTDPNVYAQQQAYADLFQGDSLGIFSLEYRFPIWNILSGVVFGDTGLFWDQEAQRGAPDAFDWSHVRSGYGVGIRVNTPLGPLRLDLGINRWRWQNWHPAEWPTINPTFSIGQKF